VVVVVGRGEEGMRKRRELELLLLLLPLTQYLLKE